ncbi:MAG: BRCT domain-containing protein [Amphritea sp.]|nr:BRCT domain-containing protein [Amphritea sp.]
MEYTENARNTESYRFLESLSCQLMNDGILEDSEIAVLIDWLQKEGRHRKWPFNVLYQRIQFALEDGVIDERERQELEDILIELSGVDGYDDIYRLTESVPFDLDAVIEFHNKEFVFTGKFAYGTRKKCQQAVEERGGVSANGTRWRTDYVVVGCGGSPDYRYEAFGSKVVGALGLQEDADKQQEQPIYLISEERWVDAINKVPVIDNEGKRKLEFERAGIIFDQPDAARQPEISFSYYGEDRRLRLYTVRRTHAGDLAFTGCCLTRGAERTFLASSMNSGIVECGKEYSSVDFALALMASGRSG